MSNGAFSRRGFLAGAGAAVASAAFAKAVPDDAVDPNLTVFLSDIHIEGGETEPHHQNALFAQTVEEVLKLRPRPARAVIFGDIARFFGRDADYAAAKPLLAKLEAAMPVTFTTGNHDHREAMGAAFPERKAASLVSGRFAYRVDLGGADLLLLDSLDETGGAGEANAGDGSLGAAQFEWLLEAAAAATRPFLVGSHHVPREIPDFGRAARGKLAAFENFAGWIHGHDHFWAKEAGIRGWSDTALQRRPFRIVSLPSTGYWGDIGFVTFRTFDGGAELRNVERDFFFLNPLKPGEGRPKVWDRLVAENNGQTVRFDFTT